MKLIVDLVHMLSPNADESELEVLVFSSLNSMLGNLAPRRVHTVGQARMPKGRAVRELKWFGLGGSISGWEAILWALELFQLTDRFSKKELKRKDIN